MTIVGLIKIALGLIAKLASVVIGFAVLVLLWNLTKYVISDEDKKRNDAKQVIIYGIITLFVMVAVWGLVTLFARTFNIHIGYQLFFI
jgi:hypothetical protein